MKLYDCRSYALLPRFAQNSFMESLCGAVDELIRRLESRCNALPCENSAASLAACRDDELAQIAYDLGAIPYYPDLPRATRENIILKAKTWTRYAGTVGAVIEMVNALFDTDSTSINDALDEPFIYHVNLDDNFIESTETNFKRFNECLEMLGHTTTKPDGFTFYFEGTFETNATAVTGDVLRWFDTNALCEPGESPTIVGFLVINETTGDIEYSANDVGLQYSESDHVEMPDEPLLIIEETPSQYDVWIESVDVANNVVIALRTVFSGLTAARANTIVNNAPTYLSRYNSYLSNQGGPYSQADAVTMRDRLQSYIPSGDGSTFGIRPVSI